jgi:hypothetical protein
MINILHEKINNILPIDGVSLNDDGSYRIDFIDQPTPEQQAEIDTVINNFPLDKAKAEKLNLVESEWSAALSSGWQTPAGWKLGIDTTDVTLLTGAFMLAKESVSMGIDNPITIVDLDGESHTLNLQDLTVLMLQYGEARALLSYQYATRRKNIKSATSIEELESL